MKSIILGLFVAKGKGRRMEIPLVPEKAKDLPSDGSKTFPEYVKL